MTIKEFREGKGLTQAELASKLGLASSTISRMERGKPILKSVFRQVCTELEIDPQNVIGVKLRGVK